MAESIGIQECLMMTGGNIDKLPWVTRLYHPGQLVNIPPATRRWRASHVVKLNQVDTGFARFACGEGDLRNIECLNSMMQMRYNATLKKAEGDQHPFDDGNADDSGGPNNRNIPRLQPCLIRTPLSH